MVSEASNTYRSAGFAPLSSMRAMPFAPLFTVDIHVAHLRKKLRLADAIVAVSKIGYRLEE